MKNISETTKKYLVEANLIGNEKITDLVVKETKGSIKIAYTMKIEDVLGMTKNHTEIDCELRRITGKTITVLPKIIYQE
jgi:hypothetical protein